MQEKLRVTGMRWTRQAQSGVRLFNFGITAWVLRLKWTALNMTPPAKPRDSAVFHQRGIMVLRVRNFHEGDAQAAIDCIATADTWNQRRSALGLAAVV